MEIPAILQKRQSNNKTGFDFVNSGRGSSLGYVAPNLDWYNQYRIDTGKKFAGTPFEGWENDDEVLWATLIKENRNSPYADLLKAQEIIDRKFNTGPGTGPTGPTTAQNAAGIRAELENLAGLFGLPEQDWSDISWQAASNNWNAAMIRDAVADAITLESASRAGIVKNVITKSRDVAANYFVNVGDEEALGWAKKIARGEMEEESIVAGIRDRAKAQYYWLAPAIDQGVTLKEYFQPHRETIAKLMEVSSESVDFINNPTWNKVVRYAPPDQEGLREMNLGEVEKYVRQQDGWQATSNAKSTAASAAASIGRIFGAL